jgi:hypothetical protein
MNWGNRHEESEHLATYAEQAARSGDRLKAEALYRDAAAAEAAALETVPLEKTRTRGITAVSMVALSYKGRDYASAESQAHVLLAEGKLPVFAKLQLRDLLNVIWTAAAAEEAGVRFVSGDVLVSVKGGEVVHGGAPLDLIIRKVEGIQAVLFRTAEMLLGKPFRRRGPAPVDLQSMFRPWLFQAPAGSYQFAVRVQEPAQMDFWEAERPKVDTVTHTFFRVLRATATDPSGELPTVVADPEYRAAFLTTWHPPARTLSGLR